MSDSDLIKLYSQRILALTTDIAHLGRLPDPKASATRRAPLCGSTVTVDLRVINGTVTDFAQEVQACALGQASAALLGAVVIGRNRAELAKARDQLEAMLKTDAAPPDAPFEGYEVLIAARDYPNRHASILLPLDATLDALAR